MAKTLNKNRITLKKVDNELIDQIWNSNNGRPAQPSTDINALPLQFAGTPFLCGLQVRPSSVVCRYALPLWFAGTIKLAYSISCNMKI